MDPKHLVLALTRLRDFLVESGKNEVLILIYDPIRNRLNLREVHAIMHVKFRYIYTRNITEITVHLHKKF